MKFNKETTKDKRLVLIDGNSLLHRAYHALPKTLTAPDGTVVNAVYGFTRMLIKVVKDLGPQYLAVAFDAKGPTFRHIEYEKYKEKRPTPESELIAQFPLVKELLRAFGVPTFEVQGFEGEDVIASLKSQISNLKTTIVTGDRDVLQLIDEDTKVYAPSKGLSDPILFDAAKVKEKYGITPQQVVDFKALKGDPSDDIPGVPGIGDKTALDLLQKYQNLDNIYKNLNDLPKRTKNLLKKHRQQAYLSQKLATIAAKAPVELNIEDCQVGKFDDKKAIHALQKLNFKSLVKELTKNSAETKRETKNPAKNNANDKQLTLID